MLAILVLTVVRDSKNPRGPVLMFTPEEWDAFFGGVRNGEFDASSQALWDADHRTWAGTRGQAGTCPRPSGSQNVRIAISAGAASRSAISSSRRLSVMDVPAMSSDVQ